MSSKKLNVLVVEDHPDVRSLLGMFLESLGHRVRLAKDADSALKCLIEREFDVLLTDVLLPDRDGWELIRELRELGYLPPVIVSMNAYHLGNQEACRQAAGCHAHLIKPFVPETLAAILQEAG